MILDRTAPLLTFKMVSLLLFEKSIVGGTSEEVGKNTIKSNKKLKGNHMMAEQ